LQVADFHEIGKIITEALTGELDDAKRASLIERTRALAKQYPLYPQLASRPHQHGLQGG
jgi:glycine/serine hydroxymethyltransferase